jgi:flavorubredoxin
MKTYEAAPDVDVLTTTAAIADFGHLAVNAFVIHADEPVLVDAGTVRDGDDFMIALRSVIDPAELRWLWLTHPDFDHIGSVHRLLAENDQLRVVTSFLGVGIMSLATPLPMDRVHLINPGQSLDVGDRSLRAVRPPAYDNPITTGLHDERSGILYSSDCFGALLDDVPQWAEDVSDEALHRGQVFWATIDSSWLHTVDRSAFAVQLDRVRELEPSMVLSSHLPAARGSSLERLLGALADVPDAAPFVGPDQAALERMLAGVG